MALLYASAVKPALRSRVRVQLEDPETRKAVPESGFVVLKFGCLYVLPEKTSTYLFSLLVPL